MKTDTLKDWKRTDSCGSLRREDIGREVVLMGWVNRRRDLGKVTFIDLRDRFGLTQIVLDQEFDEISHNKARTLRNEWVVAVRGTVSPRLAGQENPELPTGDIEIRVNELRILNETDVPPFQVDGKIDASESLRLKYRYLELRRPTLFQNIAMRHKIALRIRNLLSGEGFVEVETPFLTKSTPEGARDYLVPSRISKGCFYALPQSPQLFKQLLMVAGFDRYFQIVRCFRDEDLRADRQPEFTQVDMEMSFVKEEDVMDVVEHLVTGLFSSTLGYTLSRPFPRLEYQRAMDLYGSDKPDTRYGMELTDVSDTLRSCGFKVFSDVTEAGGVVKAINVKGGASFSRKDLDELNRMVVEFGARGLFWAKIRPDDWQSPLAKFLSANTRNAVQEKLDATEGDLIIIVSDMPRITNEALGSLRVEIGKKLDLVKPGEYSFVWITRFPLLEYSDEEERFVAVHHPFTAPLEEDLPFLVEEPQRVRARSYDLVLNGQEIGGGSVRIHTRDLQNRVFRALGLGEEAAREKFGFFLDALSYGTPPHAGIALGFDRLVAIMVGAESLRDVIAFPKTQRATCAVTDAPSAVAEDQLADLGLTLKDI